ncbi:MAG: Sapep family Mn(2+)-dependent dipeptidase [bacterium]|nr:Sapep family Mn(2+)-dependent dipeptidase [bacterium]MBU1917777.1 Sapep family Mn(2+)-dependent dipeptidase [bacterium]
MFIKYNNIVSALPVPADVSTMQAQTMMSCGLTIAPRTTTDFINERTLALVQQYGFPYWSKPGVIAPQSVSLNQSEIPGMTSLENNSGQANSDVMSMSQTRNHDSAPTPVLPQKALLKKSQTYKPLQPSLVASLFNYYLSIPAIIEALSKLISIPSVSNEANAEQGAPFGPDVRNVLDCAIAIASDLGLNTFRDENGYFGFAEIGSGEEVILIVPHLDVVPAGDPKLWGGHGPFDLNIDESGLLTGRGVQDDKGPAIAVLFALAALKEVPFDKKKKIRILFSLSEETGSKKGMDAYKRMFGNPYLTLIPDGEFPYVFEQGLVRIEMNGSGTLPKDCERYSVTEHALEVVSLSTGDNRANLVPSKLEAVFSSDSKDELETLLQHLTKTLGQSLTVLDQYKDESKKHVLRIDVSGKAAHAAQPWEGANAIQMFVQAVADIDFVETPPARAIALIQNEFGFGWDGKALGFITDDTDIFGHQTVNVGVLKADSSNIHQLTVDSRVSLAFTIEAIRDAIVTVANKYELATDVMRFVPPHAPGEGTPILQLLSDIYEDVSGVTASKKITGVRTDAAVFSSSDILSICFGFIPASIRKTFHEKPETTTINAMMLGGEVYLRVLFELAILKTDTGISSKSADLTRLFDLTSKYRIDQQRIDRIISAMRRLIDKTVL